LDGRSYSDQTYAEDENLRNVCLSQPEFPGIENNDTIEFNLDRRPAFSFSQPAHVEDLLLCTQLQNMTQPSQVHFSSALNSFCTDMPIKYFIIFLFHLQQSSFQRLVRRMTRFFVKIGCEDIIKRLIRYCEKENYAYRVNEFGVVSRLIIQSIAVQ